MEGIKDKDFIYESQPSKTKKLKTETIGDYILSIPSYLSLIDKRINDRKRFFRNSSTWNPHFNRIKSNFYR